MHKEGDEIHVDDTEASGGSKEGVVRWILGVGLVLAIVILSIIWITGALTQNEVESAATVTGTQEAINDASEGDTTDSIVSDEVEDAPKATPEEFPAN